MSQALNKYKFFILDIEVHGLLMFSTATIPQARLRAYVQKLMPVIHNYALMLAFQGNLVDDAYVAACGKTRYKPTLSFLERYGFYIYPALPLRVIERRITMSMSESDYVMYKPQTRFSVPVLTVHTALAPGSRFISFLVCRTDKVADVLGRDKSVVYLRTRLGVKRYGTILVKAVPAEARLVNRVARVAPFNEQDVKESSVRRKVIVLHHANGNVCVGEAAPHIEARYRQKVYRIAPLKCMV